jgi:hypothetical protein
MTELLHLDRLRRIALVMNQPTKAARRLVLVLQWSVDATTGRPVGHWVLDECATFGEADAQ